MGITVLAFAQWLNITVLNIACKRPVNFGCGVQILLARNGQQDCANRWHPSFTFREQAAGTKKQIWEGTILHTYMILK